MVAMSSFQANQEPVIAVQGVIPVQQQPRRTIVVRDHDVDVAVVIDVAESCSAAYPGDGKGGAGDSGHLAKLVSIALIVEQLIDLIKGIRASAQRLDTVHGAVGDEQIQPAVVVVVKPFGAETGVGKRRQEQPKFSRRVVENSTANMDIKLST